jgi:hypothetical protein
VIADELGWMAKNATVCELETFAKHASVGIYLRPNKANTRISYLIIPQNASVGICGPIKQTRGSHVLSFHRHWYTGTVIADELGWMAKNAHSFLFITKSSHQNTERVCESTSCCDTMTTSDKGAAGIALAEPQEASCFRRRRVPVLQPILLLWLHLVLLVLVLSGTAVLVQAAPLVPGLSDPDRQPKFQVEVPNPLAPEFLFDTSYLITVSSGPGKAETGLVGPDGVTPVATPIWGYGTPKTGHTWPGRTFQVQSHAPIHVQWVNRIPIKDGYLLTGIDNGEEGNFAGRSVVDTSIHYCYSDTDYTIETHGTPIVTHVHGGHTDAAFDGNAESFFSPRFAIKGPQWPGKVYEYDNSQPAAALWYHDHALGLTRYVCVERTQWMNRTFGPTKLTCLIPTV